MRPDPAAGAPPVSRRGEEVAYVALGSNLGDRQRHLSQASLALGGLGRTELSRLYETDPVGPGEQGPYLNAVARLVTRLAPRELLDRLLAIEAANGRQRGPERDAPRTLDLDLLLHGERVIDEPGLVVPHPRLAVRSFVLEPLCDLAPDLVVPGTRRTVSELAAAVRGTLAVSVVET